MGRFIAARRSPAALFALAALVVASVALVVSLEGNAGARSPAISAVVERQKQGHALDGNFDNVAARCPLGYESISGGVSMPPSQDGVVYESVKNETRGWSVGVRNPSDGGGPINYFALVFCA